eukprot:23393-Pelagococcus_subviridis.AAC.1
MTCEEHRRAAPSERRRIDRFDSSRSHPREVDVVAAGAAAEGRPARLRRRRQRRVQEDQSLVGAAPALSRRAIADTHRRQLVREAADAAVAVLRLNLAQLHLALVDVLRPPEVAVQTTQMTQALDVVRVHLVYRLVRRERVVDVPNLPQTRRDEQAVLDVFGLDHARELSSRKTSRATAGRPCPTGTAGGTPGSSATPWPRPRSRRGSRRGAPRSPDPWTPSREESPDV